jgi:hypothetical protein
MWDFYASDLKTNGSSGVLLVVSPEYTIGEMSMAMNLDPYGLDSTNHLSGWSGEAMKLENEIYLSIYLVHGRIFGNTGRVKVKKNRKTQKIIPVDFMTDEVVSAITHMGNVKDIWGASQFISSCPSERYEPPAIFAARRLRSMRKLHHSNALVSHHLHCVVANLGVSEPYSHTKKRFESIVLPKGSSFRPTHDCRYSTRLPQRRNGWHLRLPFDSFWRCLVPPRLDP